ncbi:MAG: transposase [Candidatus Microthrix sp.]|nr:transposase [Candidatus Microthrix sp.]
MPDRSVRETRPEDPSAPGCNRRDPPDHGLSNALIESTNTKIRVLTRMAYAIQNTRSAHRPALLSLGGYRPDLPAEPHQMTCG